MVILLLVSPTSNADDLCREHFHELKLGDTLATAGLFANYWKRPGSVAFESEAAFINAQNNIEPKLEKPKGDFCPRGCRVRDIAHMYFGSVPNAFKKRYRDLKHCEELLSTSSSAPFTYQLENIISLPQLTEWISDISQGDGSDGEDLYSKCDGSCSPQYHYLITKENSGDLHYRAEAQIVCGHARDRDENLYRIQYGFRWYCEEAPNSRSVRTSSARSSSQKDEKNQ